MYKLKLYIQHVGGNPGLPYSWEGQDIHTAGRDKTYNKIASHFYWPEIAGEVQEFIAACDISQKINNGGKYAKAMAPLHPFKVEPEVWRMVHVYIICLKLRHMYLQEQPDCRLEFLAYRNCLRVFFTRYRKFSCMGLHSRKDLGFTVEPHVVAEMRRYNFS